MMDEEQKRKHWMESQIDLDVSVEAEIPGFVRKYKSGRIERLLPFDFTEASKDQTTGVSSKDVGIPSGLSARLYLPEGRRRWARLPVLIYFHGGAFVAGSAFSSAYHRLLNSLVSKIGFLGVSVEYRLAPEHPQPAAYNDAWAAVRWVREAGKGEPWLAENADLGSVFLAGDSTGANIAHNMGMRAGKEGEKVEGVVLVQPFFWGKERMGREEVEREGAVVLARQIDEACLRLVFLGKGLDDPWLNPMASGELALLGCRSALVCVAEYDLLRERGRAYYEKLRESGWEGEAEFFETKRKGHGFQLRQPESQKAAQLMHRVVSFLLDKAAARNRCKL